MFSSNENDLLTRVGGDAPMGRFMRRHWFPALLSQDIAEHDGRPMRIRLLGEDLVAFRDSSGRVGVLAEHCPHRGTSLYFGRNEEDGIRCMYHGWKFDVTGQCVDMPNERPESQHPERIKQIAYPTGERNGVVWVYMGTDPAPPLPEFEWNTVPGSHAYLSMRVQESNWLQALEGDIDSSHAAFLHGRIDNATQDHRPLSYRMAHKSPQIEAVDIPAGVTIAARREPNEREYYWRVNQFLLPFFTLVPPGGADPDTTGHVWMPMDDRHTLVLTFTYHPEHPLTGKRLQQLASGAREQTAHLSPEQRSYDASRPYPHYWPKWNLHNDYGADWESQKRSHFAPIPYLWAQDAGAQESMGAIIDRSREHLGNADLGIIRVRRRLLASIKADAPLPYMSDPRSYAIRPVGITLPRSENWEQAIAPFTKAEGPIGYAVP